MHSHSHLQLLLPTAGYHTPGRRTGDAANFHTLIVPPTRQVVATMVPTPVEEVMLAPRGVPTPTPAPAQATAAVDVGLETEPAFEAAESVVKEATPMPEREFEESAPAQKNATAKSNDGIFHFPNFR